MESGLRTVVKTSLLAPLKAKAGFRFLAAVAAFFLLQLVIFLGILLLYRFTEHGLIVRYYGEFKNLSFFHLLRSSWENDIQTVKLLIPAWFLLSLLWIFFRRIALMGLVAMASFTFALFQLYGEFFQVYETTFHPQYLQQEMLSGWKDLIWSTLAEIHRFVYGKTFLFFLAMVFLSFFLYRLGLRFLLALFVLFSLASIVLSRQNIFRLPSKVAAKASTRQKAYLAEFYQNPLLNTWRGEMVGSGKRDEAGSSEKNNLDGQEKVFQYGFDTQSRLVKKRLPRIDAIPRGKRYNIIFYFFESLASQYMDLEYEGKKVLPTWHRLAKKSIYFPKHYSQFPLSANALLTVLTSAYDQFKFGLAIDNYPRIELKTVSEILAAKGYRTCYIHTGNLDFTGQRDFLSWRYQKLLGAKELKEMTPYKKWIGWGLDDRAMLEPAIAFAAQNRQEPFLLTLSPINPHHPYQIASYENPLIEKIPTNVSERKKKWLMYLNSLHYADRVLGDLIDRLTKQGLMENTILFLFADHGEAFYQHQNNYNHAFFIYEENVAVPFLIYQPYLLTNRIDYQGISRHIDILPTLLDILQIEKDEKQEGLSLISAHQQQMALFHSYWGVKDHFGIRDGDWKYIVRMNDLFAELYDLSNDPLERNNLASQYELKSANFLSIVNQARKYKQDYYRSLKKK